MSMTTQLHPGPADPRTIDSDAPPHAVMGAGAPGYKHLKCYKGMNKDLVGYLSTRGNQTVALGTFIDGGGYDPNYPVANVRWDSWGDADYLSKETTPKNRYLGYSDSDYACWALYQVRNMGYFTNVIYNPDHTISPGIYPHRFLAGPYRLYSIDWVWWAPKGNADILVCEFVD
jgi:hypothetical protein